MPPRGETTVKGCNSASGVGFDFVTVHFFPQIRLRVADRTGHRPCAVAETSAANAKYAAIVIDANTGKTLFSANAEQPRYPASLTKMMTLY